MPQLMDTCVRNGSYDDALDLKGFIGKLAFMHTDLAVVQSLVKEVDNASQSMLEQLLQKLRSNIQLPDCLRIIGYLRRLGVFSERVCQQPCDLCVVPLYIVLLMSAVHSMNCLLCCHTTVASRCCS